MTESPQWKAKQEKVKKPKATPLEPMDFGTIFREGFSYYGQNFGQLFTVYLLFGLLYVIIESFLLPDLVWAMAGVQDQMGLLIDQIANAENVTDEQFATMQAALVQTFFFLFLDKFVESLFENLALVFGLVIVFNAYRGKQKTLGENAARVFKNIGPILGITFFMTFLTSLGYTFLFLPDILFIGFLVMSYQAVTLEKKGFMKSLKKGYKYSRGNFLKIVGIAITVFLIKTILLFIFGSIIDLVFVSELSWYDPASRNYVLIFLYNLIYMLVKMVIQPIYATFWVMVYVDIRARYKLRRSGYAPSVPYSQRVNFSRQGFDQGFGEPSQVTPEQPKGLYCPYCGQLVEGDTCENCGQKLPFKRRP